MSKFVNVFTILPENNKVDFLKMNRTALFICLLGQVRNTGYFFNPCPNGTIK